MNKRFEEIKDRIIEKEYYNILNWGRNNIADFFEFLFEIKLTKTNKMFLENLWASEREEIIRPKLFEKNDIKDFAIKYIALRSLLYPLHHTIVIYSKNYFVEDIKNDLIEIENVFLKKITKLLKTTMYDNTRILFRRILQDEDVYKIFNTSNASQLILKNNSKISFYREDSAIRYMVGMRTNLNVYLGIETIEPIVIDLTLPFLTLSPEIASSLLNINDSEKLLCNQAIYQL